MTNVVLNGNAYSDDGSSARDMQGGGHRQWLLPMLGDATVAVNAPVQTALDAAAAADASAGAAQLSEGAAALAAQDALDLYNLSFALGSGWTAVTAAVADGTRTVLRVTDWTGGKGAKPGTGYMGASGLVATAAAATNVRGAVAYADLTDKPTLGTAAPLNVPATAAAAATSAQVVRGDDPRLAAAATRGSQVYTTSQSIPKSTFGTADYVFVELWGGGGSGAAGSNAVGGGEGGEYACSLLRIAELAASESLVIGSGGAPSTSTASAVAGKAGGNSTFAGLTALGGLGAMTGNIGVSKSTIAGKNGGEGAGYGNNAESSPNTRLRTGPGGSSVMGGGGGGGVTGAGGAAGGTSQFGGNGGNGAAANNAPATGFSGQVPGGGGGVANVYPNEGANLATSGAGARGQARLTWW